MLPYAVKIDPAFKTKRVCQVRDVVGHRAERLTPGRSHREIDFPPLGKRHIAPHSLVGFSVGVQ